jgi:pimeloyl-ACP methyl ester carboxylesterase
MGAQISLRVAIHRSQNHPNGKAVFNLAGGPGSSAVALAGVVPKTMWKLLTEFDLIYVDQRGTGASGYLGCSAGYPGSAAAWAACATEHSLHPNGYSTMAAAHDLEFVRRALGYSQVALRGTSYGTRLALEMMRLHPESLVACVLDGAAPPDIDIFGETLRNFDRGIALLGADCSNDPTCRALTPDVVADLEERRNQLIETPRPILFDGKKMLETKATFLDFLNEFLARKRYRFRIPGAARQATLGNMKLWDDLMSEAIGSAILDAPDAYSTEHPGTTENLRARLTLRRDLALGDASPASALFALILCSEWLPNSKGIEDLRSVAAKQSWLSPEMLDLAEACPAWGANIGRPKTRAAVLSVVPTLVLSGQLDLNTLPAWGDHIANSLPRSTHIVLPHETHSTVWTECGGSLAEQFILLDGDASKLDQGCLSTLQKPMWL